jgi:hypothetical protein
LFVLASAWSIALVPALDFLGLPESAQAIDPLKSAVQLPPREAV